MDDDMERRIAFSQQAVIDLQADVTRGEFNELVGMTQALLVRLAALERASSDFDREWMNRT